MPKVSVIVPVYNVEKYIGRCIESVQNQSLTDLELILVDDAGGDDSMGIVKEYALSDPRIKYLESMKNEGPMVARDKGCRIAKGEYIMFLDGDDSLPNNAIELLYNNIIANHVDCVKGNIFIKTNDGREKLFHGNELPYGNKKEDIFKALLEEKIVHNITGCLFRHALFLDEEIKIVQGMKNGEDAYLFYQLVRKLNNGMSVIPEVVYYYYVNEYSSTNSRIKDDAIKRMLETQKYKIKLCNDYPNLEATIKHAVVRFMVFMTLRYGGKRVKAYAKEYGMEEYTSKSNVMKYLSCGDYIDIIKFLIMRRWE